MLLAHSLNLRSLKKIVGGATALGATASPQDRQSFWVEILMALGLKLSGVSVQSTSSVDLSATRVVWLPLIAPLPFVDSRRPFRPKPPNVRVPWVRIPPSAIALG